MHVTRKDMQNISKTVAFVTVSEKCIQRSSILPITVYLSTGIHSAMILHERTHVITREACSHGTESRFSHAEITLRAGVIAEREPDRRRCKIVDNSRRANGRLDVENGRDIYKRTVNEKRGEIAASIGENRPWKPNNTRQTRADVRLFENSIGNGVATDSSRDFL